MQQLMAAETAQRVVRSTAYQMGAATALAAVFGTNSSNFFSH
jgi:hypothetical protein